MIAFKNEDRMSIDQVLKHKWLLSGSEASPEQASEEILMKNSFRIKSPLGIEDSSKGLDLPEYF